MGQAAPDKDPGRVSSAVLEIAERTLVIVLYVHFAVRFTHAFFADGNVAALLMVISEVLPVVMVLTRRLSVTAFDSPRDWALALVGTTAPLLAAASRASPPLPAFLGMVLILSGMLLSTAAKLALGRSFGLVAANRGVKVGGPYRLIRHPMYAGYTISEIGFWIVCPSLANALVYSVAFAAQVARVLREERILSQDEDYRNFSARVRYRLVPGVF